MFRILITVGVICSLLCACVSGRSSAPVTDRSKPPGEKIGYHIVSRGETLYSIAWRYNLDYKALAKANGVGSDYDIYPGQRLNLRLAAAPQKAPSKSSGRPAKPVSSPSEQTKQTTASSANRSEKQSPIKKQKTVKKPAISPLTWQWPATGKLIATFSSNGGLNKGIDIQGKLGEPVRAAASGTVVYSGSGLRGYGKLVIVKHSDKYLSAYAHNRRLLVKEGDQVRGGDKIAEMGSTGTDSVKLHFEIRYDGKPVDPMRHLPR